MWGIEGLDDLIGEVQPGTNILLVGAPMSGKSFFLRQLFYDGLENKEAGIYISTKETWAKLCEWFDACGKGLEPFREKYGVVDCVSRSLKIEVKEPPKNVICAASPIDMTGISVALNKFLEEFLRDKQIKKVMVVVESLSNLLMYSNLQTVYRFLHVFTAKVRAADALGVYSVEEGMHSPQTIATLKQLVQGMIELKDADNKRLLRVVGLTPAPSKWRDYRIEKNRVSIKEV